MSSNKTGVSRIETPDVNWWPPSFEEESRLSTKSKSLTCDDKGMNPEPKEGPGREVRLLLPSPFLKFKDEGSGLGFRVLREGLQFVFFVVFCSFRCGSSGPSFQSVSSKKKARQPSGPRAVQSTQASS